MGSAEVAIRDKDAAICATFPLMTGERKTRCEDVPPHLPGARNINGYLSAWGDLSIFPFPIPRKDRPVDELVLCFIYFVHR